ncbi:MAG: hypothetical protein B6247_08290 [Candidatus Parabeggiatoa sp. nov. 2]|nr:MAG: hypothetical protein B6247_08290 [Beggiatoa sp. 4572_84]
MDFVAVILIILQKSIKPLQLVLNEFFKKRNNGILVTKSAFTQARRHLKPEAFITLNQKAIVDAFYADGNYENAWGFRLLAIDGSKIHLPNVPEINDEFGTINFTPSYIFLASLTKLGRHFTGRCSKTSFKAARDMFKQQVTNSNRRRSQEKVPKIGTTRKNYRALC